jgi:hypothetical protein
MKSLTKILLAAALIAGSPYTFANTKTIAKVKAHSDNIQDRHLSGFHEVNVMGSFDVYIVQGATESVKVDAPDDVMNHIVTEVQGGVLKIYNKHDSGWNWGDWFGGHHKKIAIYVSARDLNSIDVTGSGDVFFKDGIHTSALKIRVSGSGDVLGKVDAKNLECSISGSGDMKISGHVENSAISVSGSGDFNARDLVTSNTSIHVSGSGDANINANNSIEAAVSGSGDVRYTGSATNVSKSKSGSGDISRM